LPLVECLISEIEQVVLNLIINAAHAITEAKEIDPQRTGLITVSTRQNGPWAEIRVADTAMGIPPEVQPKVFDPFFTTKGVGKGSGQGLAISHRIVVERHKGQLYFETQPGRGTAFVIRLPITQGGDGP
jgi:signal transduction histidine kinase